MPTLPKCSATECAKVADKHCARCESATYCSAACQAQDWPAHRPRCKELRLAAAAAAAACASGTATTAAAAAAVPRVLSGLATRVTDFHCALPTCERWSDALPVEGSDMCGGCRAVVYCSPACLQAHYEEHREACFLAIRERVAAGDVHKDDAGSEHVLKDMLSVCMGEHGSLGERTLECQSTLGRFYKFLGRHGEAEPLLRRSLVGSRAAQALGLAHPSTFLGLSDLALLLQAQGRLGEAEALYREAHQSCLSSLGPAHRSTLSAMGNLAHLLQAQGKLGEAEPLYRGALEAQRVQLGPRDASTMTSVSNLAQLLHAQGRLGEAEALSTEALGAMREALGPRHPSTLNSMNNLAGVYRAQGRLGQAVALLREALEARCSTLGRGNHDALKTMANLALLLQDQGKAGEAKPLYYEALEGQRAALGPGHPETRGTYRELLRLLTAQGSAREARELRA